MDLPDHKNAQAWAKWLAKQWNTKRRRFVLLVVVFVGIASATLYQRFQITTLLEQKEHAEIQLRTEREQHDRELAGLRHTNQGIIVENSRLQTLLDPIQRKAKELYPELENAAAVARLARDLDAVRTLAVKDIFRPPSPELETEVDKALSEFKARYADRQPIVRIEVESGSTTRRRVAEGLGAILRKHSLGEFGGGLFVGNAPDAPITLSFGANDEAYANAFRQAISPLISGEIALRRDMRMATNVLRLYLNGDPMFGPAGEVTFQ